jgi:hypothetical protein
MAKERRFRLDRDTGIDVYVPNKPPFRLEPGTHYTTDDPSEIGALESHADVTEVKIPQRDSEKD